MEINEKDLKHLHFMYWRLIELHGENENTDYMIELKNIINKGNVKSVPKPLAPPKARTIYESREVGRLKFKVTLMDVMVLIIMIASILDIYFKTK